MLQIYYLIYLYINWLLLFPVIKNIHKSIKYYISLLALFKAAINEPNFYIN